MNYGKLKKGASLLLVLGIASRPFLFGAVPISAAESNNKDIGFNAMESYFNGESMADTVIKHNYEGVKSGVNEENKFVKSESKIAEGFDKAALAVNKAVTVPKTIYVETFAEGTEDGTEAHPYSDFKTAYRAAAEGDTVVLKNSVTIQNDDNGSDRGVFTLDKAVKITGTGDGSSLNSRVPIQLRADITIENTKFFAEKIYLNGYSLSMNEVKTNTNNIGRVTVFGGSFEAGTRSGNHSVLTVTGYAQNPFEFENIYAGSETAVSDIPVTINLLSGAKVIGKTDASGKSANVTGAVEINVKNANASVFENTYLTDDSVLKLISYSNQNSPVIDDYKDVILQDSNIKINSDNSFSSVSGKLELLGNSKLDISGIGGEFNANSLNAEKGSLIILNRETGLMKIKDVFTGTIEIRTPGQDISSSGNVILDKPYMEAGVSSTGTVIFKPFFTQGKVHIQELTGTVKQWIVTEEVYDEKIDSLSIVEDGKINTNISKHELTPVAKDKSGKIITYKPDYVLELRDKDGYILTDEETVLSYTETDNKIHLNIVYNDLEEGNYILVVSEKISGKTFEIPLTFFKSPTENPKGDEEPVICGTPYLYPYNINKL